MLRAKTSSFYTACSCVAMCGNASPSALRVNGWVATGDLAFSGTNRVYVAAQDGRSFAIFARICERRTLAEVKALMPPPETLEAALKRVKKAVHTRFP